MQSAEHRRVQEHMRRSYSLLDADFPLGSFRKALLRTDRHDVWDVLQTLW